MSAMTCHVAGPEKDPGTEFQTREARVNHCATGHRRFQFFGEDVEVGRKYRTDK